jgi:hypothetical protein
VSDVGQLRLCIIIANVEDRLSLLNAATSRHSFLTAWLLEHIVNNISAVRKPENADEAFSPSVMVRGTFKEAA